MASTPFQIPGNIKQQFLPFVLDKTLSKRVTSSMDLKSASPQLFTYRILNGTPPLKTGKLNICPSSFEQFMAKDISYQLLYPNAKDAKSITFKDVYNSLPTVSIREFLPDTRLDQALNLFGDFIGKVMELLNNKKNNQKTTDEKFKKDDSLGKGFWENLNITKLKEIGQDVITTIQHAWNFMTGTTQPKNLFMSGANSPRFGNIYDTQMYEINSMVATYVMTFPWLVYYKLQSSVTTNIYELPCKLSNNLVITSDGTAGWAGENNGILNVDNMTSNIPLIGGLLSKLSKFATGFDLLSNIRVNYMPYWQSKEGANVTHPAIELTFDLYNDTNNASLINFIFVNTIAPNNRWLQYNMFQHSPCLYDVKIEGLNRLYACNAKFDVTYQGVLRDPPDAWVTALISTHGNNLKASAEYFIKNKLIKIPDIYTVKMTFQSLLPNNFNNYIFSYSQNTNQMETYANKAYVGSAMTDVLINPVADFWKEMKAYVAAEGYKNPNSITSAT